MPEFFVYLLKINVAISLFYCGYYILLRKLTFYSLNRFYILFSILISVIFPFLSFPPIFSEPEIISHNFLVVESTIENLPQIENTQSTIWLVLTIVYWLLVLFGGLKFLIRLISLYRIHLKSSTTLWKGYKFNNLSLEVTPFSFLKNTYLNFNKHTEQELHTVLKHEQVHTKNLHSLDILLIEIWTLFSWFNPISWLLKKTIKVNSEFIADHEVLKQGTSYQQYQKSLLDFATQTQHIPLTNQFSFISLKSRVIMMSKKQSSKKQLGMYFLIIPIVVASLFVFGISKAYQAIEPIEILLEEQLQENDAILNQDTVPGTKEDRGAQLLIRGVDGSSKLENPLVIVDGVQQEKAFEKGKLGIPSEEIESVEVLKDESATAIYGKKGKDGVIIITTKEKAKGINGEKGAALKGGSSLGEDNIVLEVQGYSKEGLEAKSERNTDTTIIVKGYRSIPKSNGEEHGFSGSNIDASLRESTSIPGLKIRSISKGKDDPLVIIDGQEVDEGSMQKIDPDLIESISVFKGKEAIEKYREKGKNGVIVIELKKDIPL